MLAETLSASLLGVDGVPVRVEVDVAFGLPSLTIVGLAGSQVQEARERVRSALRNSGFEVPARRITVNLRRRTCRRMAPPTTWPSRSASSPPPASCRRRAAGDDRAAGRARARRRAAAGTGVMALAAAAQSAGVPAVIVAGGDEAEAGCVAGMRVAAGGAARRRGGAPGRRARAAAAAASDHCPAGMPPCGVPDLADVIGQARARRALEIAVAGRHNLALCGPPGVGKTLLLRCAEGLQPPLEDGEAIGGQPDLLRGRPSRSARAADQRGGHSARRTTRSRPRHWSAAGRGCGPEKRRSRIAASSSSTRRCIFAPTPSTPCASRWRRARSRSRGSRARSRCRRASRLMVAFNPCPCGWRGSRSRRVRCDEAQARRYAGRLSGPLRDRIDLWVRAAEPRRTDLDGAEPSVAVAARVRAAWQRQLQRQGIANGELSSTVVDPRLELSARSAILLQRRGARFRLSPRRLHRTARVARTIADLAGVPERAARAHRRGAALPAGGGVVIGVGPRPARDAREAALPTGATGWSRHRSCRPGSEAERPYWIAISLVPGVGPVGFARILHRFGSARAAWAAGSAAAPLPAARASAMPSPACVGYGAVALLPWRDGSKPRCGPRVA